MEKKIALMDSFLFSLNEFTLHERKAAISTIKQMRNDITLPSLKVHELELTKCDSRFRSARVNADLRIIFLNEGEYCTLLYIGHHDDAYAWAKNKYYSDVPYGGGYIVNGDMEEQLLNDFKTNLSPNVENSVFKGIVTKKDLCKLGIKEIHAENLMNIDSEDRLLNYIDIFPEEIQEGLMDLYLQKRSFSEVYNELFENSQRKIDLSLSFAGKEMSRRQYVAQSMEELDYIMSYEDFEKWTLFLHPSQERLAKINANGPMLIEGGPGTGKTVLGMHRAAFLSQNVYKKSDNKKILFCTYSKKLARSISVSIEKLYKLKGIPMNVDVMGVDAFIQQQLSHNDVDLNVDLNGFKRIMEQVYGSRKWNHSLSFFQFEYYQVIERCGILSLEQYLKADRRGMKEPLNSSQREKVWEFFSLLYKKQKEEKIYTFVNRAEKLEMMILSGNITPMYDSIIIDEAQDLEPSKLRTIQKCSKNQQNGLMILSDFNQRIYSLLTWKGDVNVDVVGRTYYLHVNYRTTKEISDYASAVYFKGREKDEYMKRYKSITKGNAPVVKDFISEEKQWEAIVSTIVDLNNQGAKLNEICVVLPSSDCKEKFTSVLDRKGIKYLLLQNELIPSDADDDMLCLCYTKGIKGLEFRFVILASSEKVGTELEGKYLISGDDKIQDLYRKQADCERYVAVTRARDGLLVTYVEE